MFLGQTPLTKLRTSTEFSRGTSTCVYVPLQTDVPEFE